jgi:uncharacterized protein with HEPN domain
MQQRDKVTLFQILDSANLAQQHVQNRTLDDFFEDVMLQDAVNRRLEIVGEAIRRLSDSVRDQFSGILWSRWIGFRNVLAHQYDAVDLFTVWDTVQRDLPKLKSLVLSILPPDEV